MIKPMLAAKADLAKLKYPVYASPKLDGIRGIVIAGKLRSRSLKPIPNPLVTARFSLDRLSGLDGELILGDPTAKDVYRVTNGACARKDGMPNVEFHVFDFMDTQEPFSARQEAVKLITKHQSHIVLVEQTLINDEAELLSYETEVLEAGYEGVILRSPTGLYKYGRSTVNEGGMLKLKRMCTGEAEILRVFEELHNGNEKTVNELGRGSRSSHQANKTGKGRAGGLDVKDCETGIEFSVGTGFDDKDRDWFWKNRKKVVGKICHYSYFAIGVKVAPRHPVFKGLRDKFDFPALA